MMPTVADMMNLMIQCTNALIGTISAAGLLIYVGVVAWAGVNLTKELVAGTQGFDTGAELLFCAARSLIYAAATIVATTIIL